MKLSLFQLHRKRYLSFRWVLEKSNIFLCLLINWANQIQIRAHRRTHCRNKDKINHIRDLQRHFQGKIQVHSKVNSTRSIRLLNQEGNKSKSRKPWETVIVYHCLCVISRHRFKLSNKRRKQYRNHHHKYLYNRD